MALKPEVSIPVALGVGGLVIAIHQMATPLAAEARTSMPGTTPHTDVNRSRRHATWLSIAVVSTVSLIAKDANIAIVGGGIAILTDWWYRYENEVFPNIGKILSPDEQSAMSLDMAAKDTTEQVQANPYAGNVAI